MWTLSPMSKSPNSYPFTCLDGDFPPWRCWFLFSLFFSLWVSVAPSFPWRPWWPVFPLNPRPHRKQRLLPWPVLSWKNGRCKPRLPLLPEPTWETLLRGWVELEEKDIPWKCRCRDFFTRISIRKKSSSSHQIVHNTEMNYSVVHIHTTLKQRLQVSCQKERKPGALLLTWTFGSCFVVRIPEPWFIMISHRRSWTVLGGTSRSNKDGGNVGKLQTTESNF